MHKYFIISLLSLMLTFSGCGSMLDIFGKKIPTGQGGAIEQQETNKQKINGTMKGKVKLPEQPVVDKSGKPFPNQIIRIDGLDASVPAGATGEITLNGDNSESTYSINNLLTSWKVNSATAGLMVIGGILVAVGCVLIYFSASGIGFASIIAGGSLIACSVLVEKYPLVILAIVLIALAIGAYFLYTYIKARNLSQVKDDTVMVIAKIAAEIEKLPAEVQAQIKTNLQKDDESATIKAVVSEAKKS